MDSFKYIIAIPFFGILLLLYLILAMSGATFNTPVMEMTLWSGALWNPTTGDFFVMLGVVTLYLEILKSTKTGTGSIVEHIASMFVFILYLILFIVMGVAGTSTFLILSLMSLLDVIAGFTITIIASRRDLNVVGGAAGAVG